MLLAESDLANKELAAKLGISERTVKFHVSEVLRKTGLLNREEIRRWALGSKDALLRARGVSQLTPTGLVYEGEWGQLAAIERDIARLIARGLTNDEIRHMVKISEPRLQQRIQIIYAVLGCRGEKFRARVRATHFVMEHGLDKEQLETVVTIEADANLVELKRPTKIA